MYEHKLTKILGRINVNRPSEPIRLQSYWCSIVRTEWMKWNPKEHSHSFWELHLCLQGTSQIRVGGEERLLEPCTMLFLPPQRKHIILHESDDFVKFVWGVEFDAPEVEAILMEEYGGAGLLPVEDAILAALSQVVESAGEDQFGAYELLKDGLYRIFVLLVRKGRKIRNQIEKKEGRKEMELILDYLRKNMGATLEEVSSACYISPSTVERIVQTEYKMTFHQLRQMLRTEQIRELLHNTEFTFDQIAAATGFADRYSMGKFFKKHEGISPGEFRKAFQKK